ncbi:hypothetical protein D3C74_364910 [compost metagenome]
MRYRQQDKINLFPLYLAIIDILVAVLNHHIIIRNRFGDDRRFPCVEHIRPFRWSESRCFLRHIPLIHQVFDKRESIQNATIIPLERAVFIKNIDHAVVPG